ncbi:MAG: putative Ig domain-containing protein [Steroidobacteraceae bacterium]|nr:fibronectin type III domain-containing protein [Steroidobacteraceae bacterium]MBP7013238.1 fibronectin type III domain-containing protein [Steroidobacteraceae bacterium]
MSMINTKARALALSLLISVSLTACLGDGGKSGTSTTTPPVASPAPAPTTPPVTAPNQPPTISGTPLTSAKTNQPYAFQPTASDPDGDKVTFKVYNKPAWATFDPATGKLAGTPSSSSTGKFSNITIVASDGTNSDELGPFEITVASTATTGSATLSWQPPTENADGSPLTNLAGYVIRYGTKSDALTLELKISNPGITTAMVEGLALARWYFTVSAYTTTGVESMPSAVGSKTVT